MKPNLRVRPRLEILEDRWAPAVNIVFDSANLSISGDPGTTLTMTQTTATDVTVTDDFGTYGPFGVTGNISARLTNAIAARSITLALGANSTSGTVFISTGNVLGGNTITVTGSGSIAGDFVVTGGSGDDAVNIEQADVNGSVVANLGGQLSQDRLEIGSVASSIVAGNVIGTAVDVFEIFDDSSVGGHVILNTAGVTSNQILYFLDRATIAGNVYIVTGNTVTNGVFDIQATIGGSLTASLGNRLSGGGFNTFTINTTASINGNVTIIGKTALDDVTFAAGSRVLGNVAVHLGNSDDTLTLNGTVLGRAITFTGGNGADTLEVGATAIMGSARLIGYLGRGVDTFRLDRAATLFSAYVDYGFGADIFDPTGVGVYRYRITHRNK